MTKKCFIPRLRFRKPHISRHGLALIIKSLTLLVSLVVVFMLFRINATSNSLAQQAKDTADQNQRIAKANGRHIDCLADLFAQYTRNQKPIAKADLDKCQITEQEAAGIIGSGLFSGAVDFTTPPSTKAPATEQKTPSSNTTTKTPTATNQNPTNPAPQQTPPASSEPVRVLGIPACVPDPLGLINGGVCVTH